MTTYELVSAKGAVIRTFDTAETARKWLAKPFREGAATTNAEIYPGCALVEVITTVVRRKVGRVALKAVA